MSHLFDFPREFTENILKSRCNNEFSYLLSSPLSVSLFQTCKRWGLDGTAAYRTVFKRLKEEFASKLEVLLNSKNITFRICDESLQLPTVAVTKNSWYLCLFDKQGKYDHRVAMSFDLSAFAGAGIFLSTIKFRSEKCQKFNFTYFLGRE